MSLDLNEFRRVLAAALEDPSRSNLLVDTITQIALTGSDVLQSAVQSELERAITHTRESTPLPALEHKFDAQPRIDVFMLSPGGVVLKGRFHGKSYLSDVLGCIVDEGRALGCLTRAPFAERFANVRDAIKPMEWFSFDGGQAGFAAANSHLRESPHDRPDSIIGIVLTYDNPQEKRRDAEPNITPFSLAKLLRTMNPAVAKSPEQWLMAVPDRRFLTLKDGRSIAMRHYGAPAAPPVLAFAPIHRSTMADPFLANAAIAHGRSLMVIERPGLGASHPAPISCYRAVADDVAEVVQALGLCNVSVYGAGSAASFALAVANRLGPVVDTVALLAPRIGKPSAQAPSAWGRVMWALLTNPYSLEIAARLLQQLRAAGSAQSLILGLSVSNDRDRRLLNEKGVLPYTVAQTNDSVHLGVAGALAEFRLFRSGATFDPALVKQPIRVWQGDEDRSLLKEDTLRALSGAPDVSFNFVPGNGILIDQADADDIMAWLSQPRQSLAAYRRKA